MTRDYPALDREDLAADPLAQFQSWFGEAGAHGVRELETVGLATAGADGAPSLRMVLLKGFDARGFTFFTNLESRKGRELAENPRAALLCYWSELGRQVRIEGPVATVERRVVEAYARRRSRQSQLSALASPQSSPVPGRAWLERRVAELEALHPGAELPVAPSWGGFRLVPSAYEFWQHREHRLHDRFRYARAAGGWEIERLGP